MTPLRCAHCGTLAALAALLCAASTAAEEGPRRLLLDRAGQAQVVTLRALSDSGVVFDDAQGRRQRLRLDAVAALAPAQHDQPLLSAWPAGQTKTATLASALRTVDGQRFPGTLVGSAEKGESVLWEHEAFGTLTAPLERVAFAALQRLEPEAAGLAQDAVPAPGGDDVLLLVNGDRLSGFLRSLGETAALETDDGAVVEIPSERIAQVLLANPPEPRQGTVVWLQDGTVVVVASMAQRGRSDVELTLPTGQSAVYPLEAIEAAAFDAGSLRALASIEPAGQQGSAERLWTPPLRRLGQKEEAPLDLVDLALFGPMRVEWALPENARRFVAVAELPVADRDWGDCDVVVRVDGVEQLRRRLNGAEPRVEINIPLQGRTLSIEIEEGRYGPIRDEVVLRRPLLLLEKTP